MATNKSALTRSFRQHQEFASALAWLLYDSEEDIPFTYQQATAVAHQNTGYPTMGAVVAAAWLDQSDALGEILGSIEPDFPDGFEKMWDILIEQPD